MNQVFRCKIYEHKIFNAQNKYFHKIEALKRIPLNTYMLYNSLNMLSQICNFTSTVISYSYT